MNIITKYYNSQDASVWDVYEHPSYSKYAIEQSILDKMQAEHGFGYRIISYNKFTFTCGYLVIENDKRYLRYYTKTKTLTIEENK